MQRTLVGKVIGDLLIGLIFLLAVDIGIVMIHRIERVALKDTYRKVFLYEAVILFILFIFALDVRFQIFSITGMKIAKYIGWMIRLTVIGMTAIIFFFCGRIVFGSMKNTAAPALYAIVLGLALENGKPAKDLLLRTAAAGKYIKENHDAVLILTGGNPDKSGKTEASWMRDLLIADGVPESRICLEDRAQTTWENFGHTARILDLDSPIVLITSGYHMDRSVRTARKVGFSKILCLPVPSDPLTYGASLMWETVMEIYEWAR